MVDIPGGVIGPKRGFRVDAQRLQRLVDADPEADVFSKIVPDPARMEAVLKEIGVDRDRWCYGVPDAKKVVAYCARVGVDPPVEPVVSFFMNSKSASAQDQLERLADVIGGAMGAMGLVDEVPQGGAPQGCPDRPDSPGPK
jgi:hypothetical protein